MKRYDKYEDWVDIVNKYLPEIPKFITSEWLEQALLNRYFRNWGFCFTDLSEHEFDDDINPNIISKIPFSTRTIFPKKNPFRYDKSIFYTFDDIKKFMN